MAVSAGALAWAATSAPAALLPASTAGPADMLVYAIKTSIPLYMMVLQHVLIIGVARLTSPQDAPAAASTAPPSRKVAMLQAVLTNTVETVAWAFGIRLAWAVCMPARLAAVLPITSVLFVVGRQMFRIGYPGGAKSRFFGYGLSAYPHIFMTVWLIAHLLGFV